MTCPYCGKEMLDGEFCAASSAVVWRPAHGVLSFPPGVKVSPAMFEQAAENGYCEPCGVLVARPSSKSAEQFQKKYWRYLKNKREGD